MEEVEQREDLNKLNTISFWKAIKVENDLFKNTLSAVISSFWEVKEVNELVKKASGANKKPTKKDLSACLG